MKNIMKYLIRLLTNIALICVMLVSAQRCMNLPICWEGAGYLMLFLTALILWTLNNTDKHVAQCGLINIVIRKENEARLTDEQIEEIKSKWKKYKKGVLSAVSWN